MKIIHTHGTQDNLILFRKNPMYYRQVASYLGNGTTDYASPQSWCRLFLVPGMGHAALSALPNLIDWVENGNAPNSLTHQRVPARLSVPAVRAV